LIFNVFGFDYFAKTGKWFARLKEAAQSALVVSLRLDVLSLRKKRGEIE